MEALYLTVLRQDRTITMDLSDVNPVVPRSQIRVEDDLLTEMGAELSRLSALANQTVALQTRQATASPPAYDDALRQLGEQLFMQLFPAPTRQRLRACQKSLIGRINLRYDGWHENDKTLSDRPQRCSVEHP